MKRVELLLPAGNLDKLKIALTYGADACYIGYKEFSLRAQASNFDLDTIKEAVSFAHNLNKKVYITVNIIPRDDEIKRILPYLKKLEEIKVDGIIVSSPAILSIALKNTKLHVSLSTQASSINSSSVNFYKERGVSRVVLGRELSTEEIRKIKENTSCELEVFIHGGMCSSYSGRCTLSNYLSNRDANRGGCAHSCRWNYDVYKNDEILNKYPFQIASKDLIGIEYIKELVEIGVDSLKVEGRMKSLHYCANIAYTYRRLLDDIYSGTLKDYSYYYKLIESSENRENASGFLSGLNNESITLFQLESSKANQSFLGIVKDYNSETKEALVETRNFFKKNEIVEIMSPNKELYDLKFIKIFDDDGCEIESSRHALGIVKVELSKDVTTGDIIRRKNNE